MRGRAAYDRNRRRLLRDDPCPRQAGLGLQRLRPRRRARFARGAYGAGPAHDRAELDPCRHGAGRGRCLGCDRCDPRPLLPRPGAGAGDPLRRRADFRSPPRIAWDWAQAVGKLRADAGAARHFLFAGHAAGGRRRRQAAGAGADAQGDRGGGPARLLRGRRSPATWSATVAAARLLPPRGGFRRPSRRGGRAHHRELSRPRRARIAAQRPGPDRAGPAQHSGALRSRRARSRSAPTASILRSRRRGSPMRVRDTHIADPAAMRASVPASARQELRGDARRPHRPRAARAAAGCAHRRAAIRSISRWSIATAWRFR